MQVHPRQIPDPTYLTQLIVAKHPCIHDGASYVYADVRGSVRSFRKHVYFIYVFISLEPLPTGAPAKIQGVMAREFEDPLHRAR